MARAKGEGTFESRADGWVRLVKKLNGQRIVGPFKETKKQAIEGYDAKLVRIKERAEEIEADEKRARLAKANRTVGDIVYYCLFGVWASSEKPTTKGPWAVELAPTTYQLYLDAFKSDIRIDPVAMLKPSEVTVEDLEGMRSRMLGRVTTYTRKKADWVLEDGELVRKWRTETVTRNPRNRRTVERYMQPVINVLEREGIHVQHRLKKLKLQPVKSDWLDRRDRADYIALMPSEIVQLAVRLMLHGLCIGEVINITRDELTPEGFRIDSQTSTINGASVERDELKREQRYRTVPITEETRLLIPKEPGKVIGGSQTNLRNIIKRAVSGTRFSEVGPHDLRRSGAKWMLDDGAKITDVARILGNSPKTILGWYDTADLDGMAEAVKSVEQSRRKR